MSPVSRGEMPGSFLAELYSVNGGVYAEDIETVEATVSDDKTAAETTVQEDLAAEQAAEQATVQEDLAAAGITEEDIEAAETTVQASQAAATGNS